MPNPVVSFEIRGTDPARLRAFYAETFGWDVEVLPGEYAVIATAAHTHGENDETIYTGADAHMNGGVVIGSAWGQPGWKFNGEKEWRLFEPGVGGGIGQGPPGVTFYIQVPSLEDALDRVVANGGAVVMTATEVAPNVVIASFTDPEGNQIALIRAPR
jgi:predicted enzyme related to lactoylglutathione lyase